MILLRTLYGIRITRREGKIDTSGKTIYRDYRLNRVNILLFIILTSK